MNFLEKMNKDLIDAMKNKDKDKITTLRMVKGAMQLERINNKKEENEELLIETVSKQIKMRKESILEFEKANREDLITATKKEINILSEYLPKQLTSDEIDKIIDDIFDKIKPTSAKEMGIVMKEVTPLLKGKADMKEVSNRIKGRINSI